MTIEAALPIETPIALQMVRNVIAKTRSCCLEPVLVGNDYNRETVKTCMRLAFDAGHQDCYNAGGALLGHLDGIEALATAAKATPKRSVPPSVRDREEALDQAALESSPSGARRDIIAFADELERRLVTSDWRVAFANTAGPEWIARQIKQLAREYKA